MGIWNMWVWPLLGVMFLIGVIGYYATRQITLLENRRQQVNDTPIPQAIKEHPYSLNPIVWVYVASLVFITVVIGYYWASSP